jgi:acyl carrier protein
MELAEFTAKVREQYIDSEEIELSPETDFRGLESYDSLTGMSILVMIKDEIGVDVPISDYRLQRTVQDLFEFVNKLRQS